MAKPIVVPINFRREAAKIFRQLGRDRWDLPSLQSVLIPFNPDKIIDRWVEIAGDLPSHQFEIEELKKGEVVTYTGSAREKLHSALEHALSLYRSAGEGHHSTKQRVTELRRIETAAHRLLMLVGGADRALPRFHLHHRVAEESERLRQALGQDPRRWGKFGRCFTFDAISNSNRRRRGYSSMGEVSSRAQFAPHRQTAIRACTA
jgi:hypothetical protein